MKKTSSGLTGDVMFLFACWQNHACKIWESSHYCSWHWIPKYLFVDSLCLAVPQLWQENVPSIVLILFSVDNSTSSVDSQKLSWRQQLESPGYVYICEQLYSRCPRYTILYTFYCEINIKHTKNSWPLCTHYNIWPFVINAGINYSNENNNASLLTISFK